LPFQFREASSGLPIDLSPYTLTAIAYKTDPTAPIMTHAIGLGPTDGDVTVIFPKAENNEIGTFNWRLQGIFGAITKTFITGALSVRGKNLIHWENPKP
jgi:hypothetical protein